jgi:hypothetical protein
LKRVEENEEKKFMSRDEIDKYFSIDFLTKNMFAGIIP